MRIALVSDTHLCARDTLLTANWVAIEHWLSAVKPDRVIHLGDITADGMHERQELERARGILTRDHPTMLFIPGNHDVGDHPPGPGVPTDHPLDELSLQEYRRVFGPDRWSHQLADWQLLGLNASVLGTGTEEEESQFAWLEKALRAGTGPVGVFVHKPLFRDSVEEGIVHLRYVPVIARRRLLGLLGTRDLRFVAAGHTHQVRRTIAEGVEHVWVPSAAYVISDVRQERIGDKMVGIMLLELNGDRHCFTHIVPAGMQAYNLKQFAHIYPIIATLPPDSL
jgi:3',5'-cyclic AMP phosphodiesterase CpdA